MHKGKRFLRKTFAQTWLPKMTGIYDWNYTGIVNSEENEKNGEENTDDEDFVRTSSNSNECDDVTALDKCVVVVLVLLAECNEDKKF